LGCGSQRDPTLSLLDIQTPTMLVAKWIERAQVVHANC
jgi:hypothetical protein